MSAEPSYGGVAPAGSMLVVQEQIDSAHPLHTDYPLLPGDWLVKQEDGTFYKFAPGIGIIGFVLTAEQEAGLKPNEKDQAWSIGGMDFFLSHEENE